ncbi:MAG: apolipoprotein N-acyltransferase [Pseudonocardiaceae bacterium]|nr:apolipoprotein N-acyltransferase [Pseudonocardiaceae bacterium]
MNTVTASVTSSQQGTEQRAPSRPPHPGWFVLARVIGAAGAGVVLYLGFPPRELWWLAPIAFAGLCAIIWRRSARAGFGYGLVFALTWQLLLLRWLDDFLSPQFGLAPWLALSGVCALLVAVPVAGMAVVSSLRGAPVWMAMLFIASEAVRARFPLNGFPWSKIAYSQADGVFLPLAAVGGAPLVGFAVVLCGAGLALCGRVLLGERVPLATGTTRRMSMAGLAAILPILAGVACGPMVTGPSAAEPHTRVAVLQGNAPDVGVNLGAYDGTVWANHQRRLEEFIGQVRAGERRRPDMVLLPETVAWTRQDDTMRADLAGYADELGVPLVVGAKTYAPDDTVRNSMLAFVPQRGQTAQYDKQELVPFSEYVPLRSIASWFTEFLGSTGDLTAGDRPGAFDVAGTRVGFAICYEVAYDRVAREAVDSGAQLLAVPTNNAWFGRTEMTYQQLAMSRIRAVEHDRAVVNAATSGVSATVRPDGQVTQQTELFTPATLVADVPLRSGVTLSDRLGVLPELALTGGGLVALLIATGGKLRVRVRRRRAGEEDQPDPGHVGSATI